MGDEGGDAGTAAPQATTASGASMMAISPWLTAAVLAAYGTRALWVKLRRMGSTARIRKQLKSCQEDPLELHEDEGEQEDIEPEPADVCEGTLAVEQDEMLKLFDSDAGPIIRSIEL